MSSCPCSGTSHPLFIETQRRLYPTRLPVQLKRLIETRWSCRYESIETFMTVFTAIVQTLELISETHHSVERAAMARGYLFQMKDVKFVAMLSIMETILKMTYCLSNALQDPGLDLAAAITLINSVTTQLRELRDSADQWDEIWNRVLDVCAENEILFQLQLKPTREVMAESDHDNSMLREKRPSRVSKMPSRMQDYFTLETVGARRHVLDANGEHAITTAEGVCAVENNFRVSVFLVLIDNVLGEIDKRFSPLQNNLFTAVQSLQPTSQNFMSFTAVQPLISHYHDFLLPQCRCTSSSEHCFTSLKTELSHTKNILRDLAPQAKTVLDVVNALIPLKSAFQRVKALLQLAFTLPVSTASRERSFSCIKRVKTYAIARTSMTENRLCGLGLMSIENDITEDDNFLNNVVRKFKSNAIAEGKQRRIAL